MLLSTYGRIIVSKKYNKISINLSPDFGNYYRWLIERYYWIFVYYPKYGNHITLTNSNLRHSINWNEAYKFHGKRIKIIYNNYIKLGGGSKGFTNFYLSVDDPNIEKLKKKIGIVESLDYKGIHITIGQIGKGNSPIINKFPEIITL